MIKRFFYTLLIGLTLVFSSCTKEEQHRVRFNLVFIDDCDAGFSNHINVGCSPSYDNDPPRIWKSLIEPGYEWNYEYWVLQNGQNIEFLVSPQQGYHFIMNVYIDDELISSREILTAYGGYYGTTVLDESGLNNYVGDMARISFTYVE
tara:strand:- start:13136 stop:13579 length:444 start_codon:yes stop_codon:yes gene_type:complete